MTSIMRAFLCAGAFVFLAGSAPIAGADTTYTVSQTFPVDGGVVQGCGPSGQCQDVATTGSITGTITTDGNTGVLSSTDIIGFDLTDKYGEFADQFTKDDNVPVGLDGANAQVVGSDLYATSNSLLFTTGSGGGSLIFLAADGHQLSESLSNPICFSSPCTISDPAALNFYLAVDPDQFVTGSIPFTAAVTPIATATPEPSMAILLFLGLALITLLRKWLTFWARSHSHIRSIS